MYVILPYTKNKAKQLNVIVKPSNRKNKKIDVFNSKGQFLVSIGDINYLDYPYYIRIYDKEFADYRRKLYKKRHSKDRQVKFSAGWFADKLLW